MPFDIDTATVASKSIGTQNKMPKITKSTSASVLEGKVSRFHFSTDAKKGNPGESSCDEGGEVDRSPSKLIVVEKDVTDDSVVVEDSETSISR
mgnify:CR=1 FL=1